MINFARNFTALRRKNGLSQEQMAEKCRVSRSALAKWETGSATPDVYHIVDAAKIFGVTVDELLNGKMNPIKDNTMEVVCDKLDGMLKMQSAINKRGQDFNLYKEYCKIQNERVGDVEVLENEEWADYYYTYGSEYAEKGDYSEAIDFLEKALTYGVIRAVDELMVIHNDVLQIIESNQDESQYWSYRLEVARKMQHYGKIIEEEIKSGKVF